MKFEAFYKAMEKHKYYVFSSQDLAAFFPREDANSLKTTLYRWKEKGWIHALKRGLYELSFPRDLIIPDLYIANRLYSPSYVSLETALSHYSIIPEVSLAVTSITTKTTRRFKNKHGLFLYRTIKPCAFCGYYVEKQAGFNILIAEPEKAFIDYLYLQSYRKRKLDFSAQRLEKEVLSRLKKKRLDKYAKLYNLNLKEFYAYL